MILTHDNKWIPITPCYLFNNTIKTINLLTLVVLGKPIVPAALYLAYEKSSYGYYQSHRFIQWIWIPVVPAKGSIPYFLGSCHFLYNC